MTLVLVDAFYLVPRDKEMVEVEIHKASQQFSSITLLTALCLVASRLFDGSVDLQHRTHLLANNSCCVVSRLPQSSTIFLQQTPGSSCCRVYHSRFDNDKTKMASLSRNMSLLVLMAVMTTSSWLIMRVDAFLPTYQFRRPVTEKACGRNISLLMSSSSSTMSDFDFPSAMPEKPVLSIKEKMHQSADDFVASICGALGDTPPPPELDALKEARANDADVEEIALKTYILMIERGMLYDEDPDTGSLTPTDFDIPNNLNVPEVQQEFAHLYKYGMMLMEKGWISVDDLTTVVKERLVKRTGLTPEKFDEWLGY